MELNTGIKCKKAPDLFGPIVITALFQKIYAPIPANRTTYAIVKKTGILRGIWFPDEISKK